MKVLWVIGSLENGGAERVLLKVVNELSSYGIESTIFVLSNNVSLLEDIHVKAKVIKAKSNTLPLRYNFLSVFHKLYKCSKKNDVIVGSLEFLPTYIAVLVAFLARKNNINWFHTLYSSYVDKMSFVGKFFAYVFYKNCSKVIFVSESAKLDFIKTLSLKRTNASSSFQVIYNPITHDFPIDNITNQYKLSNCKNKPIRFLFVGRLEPVKNVIFIILALSVAKNLGLQFHLDIVGDGSLYMDVKEKIILLNLEHEITLCGYSAVVSNFYKNADFLLVPSIYEGFGGVVLEAYYNSLPVITFDDSGGPVELLKILDFGYISSKRDIHRFAEELIQIADNRGLYEFLPKNHTLLDSQNIISSWVTLLRSIK